MDVLIIGLAGYVEETNGDVTDHGSNETVGRLVDFAAEVRATPTHLQPPTLHKELQTIQTQLQTPILHKEPQAIQTLLQILRKGQLLRLGLNQQCRLVALAPAK